MHDIKSNNRKIKNSTFRIPSKICASMDMILGEFDLIVQQTKRIQFELTKCLYFECLNYEIQDFSQSSTFSCENWFYHQFFILSEFANEMNQRKMLDASLKLISVLSFCRDMQSKYNCFCHLWLYAKCTRSVLSSCRLISLQVSLHSW